MAEPPAPAKPFRPAVVPGRECGGCHACCVVLTIDDPELRKLQGIPCHHLDAVNRCGIYPSRPETCRVYQCGWKVLPWLRPGMRPDLSGMLVRIADVTTRGKKEAAVVFTMLRESGAEADGLPEAVATAITTGWPVYMEVLGPPGFSHPTGRMNEVFGPAVRARDRATVLRMLRACWGEAMAQAEEQERRKVSLGE